MAQHTKNGSSHRTDIAITHPPVHNQDQSQIWNNNKPITESLPVIYNFSSYGPLISWVMFAGFALSIILAVIFRFEETTYTHCRVANYFPSISASISTTPSAYVWRFVVCLCTLPRLFFLLFCYNFYICLPGNHGNRSIWYKGLCHLCFVAEMLEHLCLLGLTCISSNENYEVHEASFISFQITAMIHMILMCIVFKMATTLSDEKKAELGIVKRHNSLQWKLFFCTANILFFLISVYFFFRHQHLCEPGVYSLFAIFEYLVVTTNILFHYDKVKDFSNRILIYGGQIHDKGI